jgi:hypothetical protein
LLITQSLTGFLLKWNLFLPQTGFSFYNLPEALGYINGPQEIVCGWEIGKTASTPQTAKGTRCTTQNRHVGLYPIKISDAVL